MLVVAAALGSVGLAASDSRWRLAAFASAVVAVAWGWGSLRLAQLDRSVLASRIGAAEWAVGEGGGGGGGGGGRGAAAAGELRPGNEGARASLGSAPHARAGPARAPAR